MKHAGVIVALAAQAGAGCVGDTPAVSTVTSASDPATWEPEQGIYILGSTADGLTPPGTGYIRFSSQPAFRTRFHLSVAPAADGAHLVADSEDEHHEKDDPWFKDLILVSVGGQWQLRITGAKEVNPIDLGIIGTEPTASSTVYTLSYRSVAANGTTGAWADYCGSDGGIALKGFYDRTRIHVASDTISFGCGGAIANKCAFWGYQPGNAAPGARGWDHHQSCTLMGNAEYCMDDQPHTREETPILIRDNVGRYGNEDTSSFGHPTRLPGQRDSWPGDPDTFYIEAGWRPSGPICLSRLRWASLPPRPCEQVLRDPRFSDDPEARFCDQWSIAELFQNGAILVNGSKLMDAPLHRWQSSAGDHVSTIRGFFVDRNHDGAPDPESILPFADPSGKSPYVQYVGTDGMLLRNLPGTLSESKMQLIYMQGTATADRYLSSAGTGRGDPHFEGYSFLFPDTFRGLRQLLQCAWSAVDRDTHLAGPGGPTTCGVDLPLSFALPAP